MSPENIMLSEESSHKGPHIYDAVDMKCTEKGNIERKADWLYPRAEKGRRVEGEE